MLRIHKKDTRKRARTNDMKTTRMAKQTIVKEQATNEVIAIIMLSNAVQDLCTSEHRLSVSIDTALAKQPSTNCTYKVQAA